MTPSELEQVYERLALTIDRFDEPTAQIFLAKLALVMAQRIGNADDALACIEDAAQSLGD